jgi:hypothetical protein
MLTLRKSISHGREETSTKDSKHQTCTWISSVNKIVRPKKTNQSVSAVYRNVHAHSCQMHMEVYHSLVEGVAYSHPVRKVQEDLSHMHITQAPDTLKSTHAKEQQTERHVVITQLQFFFVFIFNHTTLSVCTHLHPSQ